MAKKYYAHSLEGEPPEKWQPLEKHLKNVAERARLFADAFGAGDWGYLAGLWHDLGKYFETVQIQQKILRKATRKTGETRIAGDL
jgi:HD superfamily phosphohydrolase YqeK